MKHQNDQSDWEWNPCSQYVLKLSGQNEKNLQTRKLYIENSQYNYNFTTKLWKPFNFSNELGWNWHKSWSIPEVECSMIVADNCSISLLTQLVIRVNFYIVLASHDSVNLQNVGCNGECQCQMESGSCVFRSLKFTTTSYKNDYQKFQLVIVVSQMIDNQSYPLDARISPEIFVDSRKNARVQITNNSFKYFLTPFQPQHLEKVLVKKQRRNTLGSYDTIDNGLVGFINYFTAQNIRHKIKHPLFLAIKFNECIKLYLGYQAKLSNSEIIVFIQNLMTKNSKPKDQSKKQVVLLVQMQENTQGQQKKKVLEILSHLENDSFAWYTSVEMIPVEFKLIENPDELKEKYRDLYPKLINQNSYHHGQLSVNSLYQLERQFTGQQQKKVKMLQQDLVQQVQTQTSIECEFITKQMQFQNDYLLKFEEWQKQLSQIKLFSTLSSDVLSFHQLIIITSGQDQTMKILFQKIYQFFILKENKKIVQKKGVVF